MRYRWRVVPFHSEVKLLSGGTPKKSQSNYWGGHIPWVSSGEMTQHRIYDTHLHVTEDGMNNGTRLVPENTVLVVVRGMSLAKEFRIALTKRPTTFNQDLKALQPSSKVDPQFLFYYLQFQRNAIRDSATDASHGTKKLETRVLESWPLPLPELNEQYAIRDVLSAYDDLIDNNHRRIQLLEQAARLLYKEWFVHLRFPGHEHVKINNGVLEGWKRKTLGDIVATNQESYRANGLPSEINYIDISSVKKGRIVSKSQMLSVEAPGRARRKANSGDVIWSNVRPNLRAFALVLDPEEHDVFSTGFTVLSPKDIPFSFLYLLVTTDDFVGHLVNHTTGVSYPAVRPDDFERASILLPPKPLLKLFHEKTEPIFRLNAVLEEQSKRLSQARNVLLPRLINNEVTI